MKFCPTCRRHLNGAYSCSGCGTPAADLPTAPLTDADGPDATRTFSYREAGDPPSGGRAELRERQRQRSAKRRRAVLIGSVGALVLAAAGVAVANGTGAPGASAPDAGGSAGGPAATASDDATPLNLPSDPASTGHLRPTHHPHSPSASATASASVRPSATRSPAAGGSAGTTGGASSAGTGSNAGSSSGGTPSSPSAKPSPSSTCHPFLFWCS